jgi:hypothetical protein
MTAGSSATCEAYITKRLTNIQMLRSGVEVAFCLLTDLVRFDVQLSYFDGAKKHVGSVRYDFASGALQYVDWLSAWHTFAVIGGLSDAYGLYQHLKLAVDFAVNHYVRVIFNDQEYDLSSYRLEDSFNLQLKHYEVLVYLQGRLTFNDQVLVGHVILTGNEP